MIKHSFSRIICIITILYSFSSFAACEEIIRQSIASSIASGNYAIHDFNDGIENYLKQGHDFYLVTFYIARTDLKRSPLILKKWKVRVDAQPQKACNILELVPLLD